MTNNGDSGVGMSKKERASKRLTCRVVTALSLCNECTALRGCLLGCLWIVGFLFQRLTLCVYVQLHAPLPLNRLLTLADVMFCCCLAQSLLPGPSTTPDPRLSLQLRHLRPKALQFAMALVSGCLQFRAPLAQPLALPLAMATAHSGPLRSLVAVHACRGCRPLPLSPKKRRPTG